MNKLKYIILGAAAVMMVSCSQDEMPGASSNVGGRYIFEVKLPVELTSRADFDGSSAGYLNVAVYQLNSDGSSTYAYQESGQSSFNGNTATVGVDLVAGKDYKIVFFAQSQQSVTEGVYSFNANPQTGNPNVTVNYGSMTSAGNLANAYECFYGVWSTTDATTSATNSISVTLSRPVAQVNWGTGNLPASGAFGENGANIQTTLVATDVPNVLNLLNGEVSGSQNVTLEDFAKPQNLTYPVSGYYYIGTQFLLAPSAQSANYTLTLSINNGGGTNAESGGSTLAEDLVVKVDNAPLQANYRTNIYGNLLTNNAAFSVSKPSTWGQSDLDDAITAVKPSYNEATKVYTITSQGHFMWMANMVNSGDSTFSDKTFVLGNDIYLSYPLTPIGYGSYSSNGTPRFNGSFDGQNHTIYDLEINVTSSTVGAGLFGLVYNSSSQDTAQYQVFKDVTFKNAKVTSAANNVGVLIGTAGRAKIWNVHVEGEVQVSSRYSNAGGIVGNMFAGSVQYCSVTGDSNSSITAGNNAGGIIGNPEQGTFSLTGNTTNIPVSATAYAGGIAGRVTSWTWPNTANNVLNIEDCTASGNVTVTGTGNNSYYIGGIAGAWNNQSNQTIKFTGCTYSTGTLSSAAISSDSSTGLPAETFNIVGYALNSQQGELWINGDNVTTSHPKPGENWNE